MSRSLRALLLAVGLVVAALPVAPVVAQTPTDLSMWVFVDRHGAWMAKQAEKGNAAFPDRPITVTPTTIAYQQMHDNLLAALVAGTGAPDLVDIEIGKFATFVKDPDNIHLLDLTDVVTPYLPDLVATRMAPYQAGGKQLGIDYHLGAYLMYYNKTLLDQAGIDPDTIKTWDDYRAAGKTFQEKVPDASWASVEGNSSFTARGLMLQNGGGAYDKDGNLVLDSEANAAALQMMSDWVNVDKIATIAAGGNHHAEEFYATFHDGKVASLIMPQWYMTRFPDNLPDMCGSVIVHSMPVFAEGGFTTTMGGGTGTAVTDQTPADEQQLAKDFLAWAKLTKEGQTSLWKDLGFDPYRNDVYDDPALSVTDNPSELNWPTPPSAPCFNDAVTFGVIKSELGNVAPEYTGPLYPEIQNDMNTTMINDILEGGVAPADALKAAQERVIAGG